MLEALIVILVLIVVGYFIIKNYNPTIILMGGAFILLLVAIFMGYDILPAKKATEIGTEAVSKNIFESFIDIFLLLKSVILKQLNGAGLILMILFGYSGYMNKIGANQVAVDILVEPMKKIKSKAVFVLLVFYLGNLMSLVVPSASSLAIILMSILYPMLQGLGVSSLTAAGVIAMTATIMPTPLGADNIIAAEKLNMDLLEYVKYNAEISIPVLIILGVVHLVWQNFCDKREGESAFIKVEDDKFKSEEKSKLPLIYAILPVLPLILIVVVGLFTKIKLDIFVLTFISFVVAIVFETIRTKDFKAVTNGAMQMFTGMGEGFGRVVMLVVAGSLFTKAVESLGVIDSIVKLAQSSESAGIYTMFSFVLATSGFGILSGGGLPMFYATIDLIPEIAKSAGVHGMLITLPMQMTANLVRTVSPVAAVIMIVASTVGVSPTRILKRTVVPSVVAIILVMIFALIRLPF